MNATLCQFFGKPARNWRVLFLPAEVGLAYVFDSIQFRTQIRYAVKGVKVFSITQAILRNANIWLPTLFEQQKTSSFLDEETKKIDNLISKAKEAVELMQERRTALISAAVTGKIDVRDVKVEQNNLKQKLKRNDEYEQS